MPELSMQGAITAVVSILGSWAALAGLLISSFTSTLRGIEEKLTCINKTVNELDKQLAVWSHEVDHTRDRLQKLITKCEERHE